MFLFYRNERTATKRDTLVFDYLSKIDKDIGKFAALYVFTSKLENQALKTIQRQTLVETFESVVKRFGGEIFGLANEDTVVIYNHRAQEEIQACLVKLQFMFNDDPFLQGVIDLEDVGFIKFFDFINDMGPFKAIIKLSMSGQDFNQSKNAKDDAELKAVSQYNLGQKALRRELSPTMLSRVKKTLSMTDFSSLIRRQSVCAVIGKAVPQVIFDEIYVSISDLCDMLLPDVDLTANPWLFQHLTETLDQRVLASVSQHDDGSFRSNFSLNMNVSTILSDEFLRFDGNMNSSIRSTIVLELQLVDILSDVKAFILARTFAQYRGYKICIDGVTVDRFKYINREFLKSDLIKIIWHPSFMDLIKEDEVFTNYDNKRERAKMILCRVDDPQAIEVGNSVGINLYQGRYIQKLLVKTPKKTIYSVRK